MPPQQQPQSSTANAESTPRSGKQGWTPLPLEHLPLPTYWPAGLALAITFIFWGLITSWVILLVGLVQFVVSIGGWIQDIRYERKQHPSSTH
jgi:hypothetical protein